MKYLFFACLFFLSGCTSLSIPGLSGNVKPVEVQTKAVDKTPLNIDYPTPLKFKKLEWVIITPENANNVFADLEKKGHQQVIIGLTADGYELLSLSVAEIRNFVNTQRNIIIKYKEYYEPKAAPETEK